MPTRLEISPERLAEAARRVMQRCDELARVTATPGRIERVYLSPEHARVNRLAAEWMREIGMTTWQDAAGNQIGRLEQATASGGADAPALMIGSHLDTVPDAGRFDGIVGVLMGLEVVRMLRSISLPLTRARSSAPRLLLSSAIRHLLPDPSSAQEFGSR